MNPNVPEFLFHYTTLENLALILKNKTFRFTRLSNLNDPLEGKGHNFSLAEHFVYSSSWTAAKRDTIPMWKMYSDLKGVRLKLPGDLFEIKTEIRNGPWGRATFNHATLSEPIELQMSNPLPEEGRSISSRTIAGPDPIQYLSDGVLTETEQILYDDLLLPGLKDVVLGPVGLFKNDAWAFEKEWRFRFLPWVHLAAVDAVGINERMERSRPMENFVDVPMRDAALENLEVMLGPKTDEASKVIADALLEKFAPKATVTKSKISIV